ncbi:hypothetical protein [Magnetospirillum moscoviense]|uniref:hypothetical protein n=1 Tax=Magnetospirillum moscoviense TaxID=1437059 RepID=UPI0012E8728B|nr:hypothetical protein [Magnetospirillum moscoviense]MBF0324411.1 hypothetical protein [Alphaproteobacteria bacterium]
MAEVGLDRGGRAAGLKKARAGAMECVLSLGSSVEVLGAGGIMFQDALNFNLI